MEKQIQKTNDRDLDGYIHTQMCMIEERDGGRERDRLIRVRDKVGDRNGENDRGHWGRARSQSISRCISTWTPSKTDRLHWGSECRKVDPAL